MGLRKFKPNTYGSGVIFDVDFSSKGGTNKQNNQLMGHGFFSVTKQRSYNKETQKPVFVDENGNIDKKTVKLSTTEMSGLICALQLNQRWMSDPHENDKGYTTVIFGPRNKKEKTTDENGRIKWVETDVQDGYGFALMLKGKNKDSKAERYIVNLTYAEGFELIEYIKFILDHIFSADYAFTKKKRQEFAQNQNSSGKNQQNQEHQENQESQAESSDSSENDDPPF